MGTAIHRGAGAIILQEQVGVLSEVWPDRLEKGRSEPAIVLSKRDRVLCAAFAKWEIGPGSSSLKPFFADEVPELHCGNGHHQYDCHEKSVVVIDARHTADVHA